MDMNMEGQETAEQRQSEAPVEPSVAELVAALHDLHRQVGEQDRRISYLRENQNHEGRGGRGPQTTSTSNESMHAHTPDSPTGPNRSGDISSLLASVLKTRKEDDGQGKPTKVLDQLGVYDGRRDQLETWISQAQAKLQVDYQKCSEEAKFYALHNRLRGEAARQLQPWVQTMVESGKPSTGALIEQLRGIFGDPHKAEKARRRIHNLRQLNRSFMDYYVEFQKLVLDAGGSTWPDQVKVSYLEAGLSKELLQQTITTDKDQGSFEEYVGELKRVSDKMEAYRIRSKSSTYGGGYAYRPSGGNQRQGDAMDWEPTGPAKAAEARRAKWVSKEEIEKRKAERRCYRCGGNDHQQRYCKQQPARRPQTASAATKDEGRLIEEVEEDDEPLSGSEN